MTPQQKIAKARQLLIEATRELRQQRKAAIDAHDCQCGHRRDQHTVTCDINYTGGFCMATGCACRWFLLQEEAPA